MKEPIFEVKDDSNYESVLSRALYWYSVNKSNSIKKEWFVKWAKQNDIKNASKIPETTCGTLGAIARLLERDFPFKEKSLSKFYSIIEKLNHQSPNKLKKTDNGNVMNNSKNISSVYSVIDIIIDDIITDKIKKTDIPNFSLILSKNELNELIDHYTTQLDEIKNIETDDQLQEAYSYLNKWHQKRLINFYEGIISKFKLKLAKGNTTRKKRISKPVSPYKLVSKLNYKKDSELVKGLYSESPKNIINAKSVLLFNENNRQLHFYNSPVGESLSIKGSTIIGFDPEKSFGKTLRKPELINELKTKNKSKIINELENIKAVKKELTGRVNKHHIIVKIL